MAFKRLSKHSASPQKKDGRRLRSRVLNRLGITSNKARVSDGGIPPAKVSEEQAKPVALKSPTKKVSHRRVVITQSNVRCVPPNEPSSPCPRTSWEVAIAQDEKFATPPPIPSRSKPPPCPTAYPRLPHTSISVSYSMPLQEFQSYPGMPKPKEESSSRVCFASSVQVMEIPSHVHYSKQARDAMWTSPKDIDRLAKRNAYEYWADGKQWEDCKEEDEMLEWNGKLLHPFTYERMQNMIAQTRMEAEHEKEVQEHAKSSFSFREMLFGRSHKQDEWLVGWQSCP
ncbi:expressed unknown protein [Seminavis robusta]|uniref:Uncharacterized protein n=1 Tax=Seminavis robusta TaxID=568900 RepID=A0A9N8DJF6_9STRA|nr:expressed unknown protein [Seminavis robusta]|eukprot:Sro155_g070390.1 n/a (284) ;mRNA; f:29431-30282